MVNILVVSDFHGELSNKLISIIKKENPDFILSSGDFCGNKELAKLYFKHVYGKSEDEISNDIKKKAEFLEKEALRGGIGVIKQLKSLQIPIYAIRGNWDPAPFGHDLISQETETVSIRKFEKLQSKNFNFVDFKTLDFGDFVLVGGVSSTSPINPRKYSIEKLIREKNISKSEANAFIKKLNRNWNARQKNYEDAFAVAKRLNKKIIFLTHNCPYNTKLDKIKHGPMNGKHYGSYQERLIIKKYQPDIVLCGHMHENFGKDKIGKSIIYNSGSALDGKFKILRI